MIVLFSTKIMNKIYIHQEISKYGCCYSKITIIYIVDNEAQMFCMTMCQGRNNETKDEAWDHMSRIAN
jgi:hypothetical protein